MQEQESNNYYDRQAAWAALLTVCLLGLVVVLVLILWLPWWVTVGAMGGWIISRIRIHR